MQKTVEQRVIEYFQKYKVVFETATFQAFASRDRKTVKQVIDSMIQKGIVLKLGQGVRGDPVRYVISPSWPHNVCWLCGHTEAPSVDLQKEWPKAESVRLKRKSNKVADALRPTYRMNDSGQYEVLGRQPMFGHQGAPIVLFTGSRESCKAYLKVMENQEVEMNAKGCRGVYTNYGAFAQPVDKSTPFLVIGQVDGEWLVARWFYLQSEADNYASKIGYPSRVILCQTGRTLNAYDNTPEVKSDVSP